MIESIKNQWDLFYEEIAKFNSDYKLQSIDWALSGPQSLILTVCNTQHKASKENIPPTLFLEMSVIKRYYAIYSHNKRSRVYYKNLNKKGFELPTFVPNTSVVSERAVTVIKDVFNKYFDLHLEASLDFCFQNKAYFSSLFLVNPDKNIMNKYFTL